MLLLKLLILLYLNVNFTINHSEFYIIVHNHGYLNTVVNIEA